jgi:hypothetical protein
MAVTGSLNFIPSQFDISSPEAEFRDSEAYVIDPIVVLREIVAIRPFQFTVAETGKSNREFSRSFFEQQAKDGKICNIVCSSLGIHVHYQTLLIMQTS